MRKIILFGIFLYIFLLYNSIAQSIPLIPGNATFTVSSIILYPVDDYTGNKQYIGLFGDKTRIDILWNANYNPESLDPINVTCWLNCNNSVDVTKCYGFQNCSYQGKTGPASCTIFSPNYNYSTINNITCKFFNPNYPSIEYRTSEGTYPQRVFYPIKYSVSVSGGIYQVGRTISLPITFVSYSFLNSNYTGFAYVQSTSFISIDNSYNTTNILKYSQIETVYPRITVIYSGRPGERTPLYINTTVNELPNCTTVDNCPNSTVIIQGLSSNVDRQCIEGKCQYIFTTEIGSAYLSLPEYGTKELLLIIIGAILLFLAILKIRNP
jgi:hypothetical protein